MNSGEEEDPLYDAANRRLLQAEAQGAADLGPNPDPPLTELADIDPETGSRLARLLREQLRVCDVTLGQAIDLTKDPHLRRMYETIRKLLKDNSIDPQEAKTLRMLVNGEAVRDADPWLLDIVEEWQSILKGS